MTLSRFTKKFSFHLQFSIIGLLVFVNHRLYMKYYNRLLISHGFKINGTPRFIAKSARFDDFDRITLGDRVVISMNVHFLTHDYSITTALIAANHNLESDKAVIKDIVVGNNVFIGMNSIILPGVTIGDHVIIGAGSVVRGVIPNFSIVAGNPASIIGDIREHAAKTLSKNDLTFRVDKN
jgi:acetyltransferase-like isoleucine patch superfamily enzyme